MQLLLVGVQRFVYPSWTRLAIVLAGLLVLSAGLEAAVRWRARRIDYSR